MEKDFKQLFPLFKTYPDLAYLDSAATTQTPQSVLDSALEFETKCNANVHRGLYPLSETATEKYEQARHTVAEFIGAKAEEIIFTGGTTDSLNAAATMLSKFFQSQQIKVLTTELEHHSSFLPWRHLEQATVKYWEIDSNFELKQDEEYLKSLQAWQPDVIAISQGSNVTGTVNDLKRVRQQFPKSIIIADAAQTIGHIQVDVRELDCDLLAFSAHKMYGPTGVGVLYIRENWLSKLQPFRVGGGMISEVTRENITWAEAPEKFEAGTPPIVQTISLAAACNFIKGIGWEQITTHEQTLRQKLLEMLKQHTSDQNIYHSNQASSLGIVAFNLPDIHPHDAAFILGENNVAVRAGHHCNQILHREVLDIPASLRASMGIYTTGEDIQKLETALQQTAKIR